MAAVVASLWLLMAGVAAAAPVTPGAVSVSAWGYNGDGQLGDGTTTDSTTPVAVSTAGLPADTTFTAISAGADHSLALTSTGAVYAWGDNGNGELGNGTTTDSTTPVAVSAGGLFAGQAVTAIASGSTALHSLEISALPATAPTTSVPEASDPALLAATGIGLCASGLVRRRHTRRHR